MAFQIVGLSKEDWFRAIEMYRILKMRGNRRHDFVRVMDRVVQALASTTAKVWRCVQQAMEEGDWKAAKWVYEEFLRMPDMPQTGAGFSVQFEVR